MGGQVVGQAPAVLLGLHLHAGQCGPFTLGLHHASGLPVHVQQVVRVAVAGLQGELAHRDARGRVQVDRRVVLDGPSRPFEHIVYLDARL